MLTWYMYLAVVSSQLKGAFIVSTLDNFSSTPTPTDVKAQSKQKLSDFFQNKRIKSLISVLVPGALAAALFPVFGPIVAGVAAGVAIKNGLSLLGISLSDDTISKLVKPLEGRQLDEDEMQDVLQNTLEQLLPKDKNVNDESAKALVTFVPSIKEAALTNPKLDVEWLGESLKTNLEQQGEAMAKVASNVRELIQLDGAALDAKIQHMLANWTHIIVEVTAREDSEVSDVDSRAKARGGAIGHKVAADIRSKIEKVKIDSEIN